ncbi:hypothetical protein TIFTF001_004721 [Ficus carica]|uniref:Uncharacterized protein n=1 Tax=Ficus carica TaxID=3494 RepID=A0AA87ZW37_FICCA|nr:hypothetical protein TIFTF001_004721 [Ficus carica]
MEFKGTIEKGSLVMKILMMNRQEFSVIRHPGRGRSLRHEIRELHGHLLLNLGKILYRTPREFDEHSLYLVPSGSEERRQAGGGEDLDGDNGAEVAPVGWSPCCVVVAQLLTHEEGRAVGENDIVLGLDKELESY